MGIIHKITQQTKNRFLNLFELEVTHKSGKDSRYFVASRAEKIEDLKISTKKNTPDGVIIFSIVKDDDGVEKVVLIRQYRYPIDGFIYEFPAGLVDSGEAFGQAAIRELKEETGLVLNPIPVWEEYEKPYFTTIGMTDESCATVYGYASGQVTRNYQEDSEEIEVVLADKDEIRRILKEERVAIVCAYMLLHYLHDEEAFGFLKKKENSEDTV